MVACCFAVTGCGVEQGAETDDGTEQTANEIRSVSKAEALADFDQLATSFKGLYGAMERKETRYGFKFDALAASYRTKVGNATSEAAVMGLFQEFISNFRDAHVSLAAPFASDVTRSFSIPLLVMPVEQTFVVYAVGKSVSAQVQKGEELLSIDGASVASLMTKFAKYVGTPNPLSSGHMTAELVTFRPSYLSAGLKDKAPVVLQLRRADGTVHKETLAWAQGPQFIPPASVAVVPSLGKSDKKNLTAMSTRAERTVNGELTQFGARVPFFMTPAVKTALRITAEVKPSLAALQKVKLTQADADAVNYFAVTYAFSGKKYLLVRLPDYQPSDANKALAYLTALFSEQQDNVDALILDQTHNPGGSIGFAAGVVSLLTKKTINGYVQRMHGDRQWIGSYERAARSVRANDPNDPSAATFDARARLVDEAYSSNKSLSDFIPFFFDNQLIEADPAHWTKPVMVLADELSVSCADFVPLLVQANSVGTLFGQRTMGGGGNVEEVAVLTNTQASLSISRGLGSVYDPTGAYPEARIIEDNGVTPDVTYSHTLADYRAGYVGYVQAFNSEMFKHVGP